MLELDIKSLYGSWHLPVTLEVVSTNHHTLQPSAVVSGGTSFYARTAHLLSVRFNHHVALRVVFTDRPSVVVS